MSTRRSLTLALALIAMPVLVIPIQAARYYVANADTGSIISSGLKREYLLYVPKSVDPAKPAPLVISLHGGALWAATQRDFSQFNRVADREGFIVVYPNARGPRGARAWHEGDGTARSTDVRFISELIDTIAAHHRVDPLRIYANGLSNGGGMTFALSCTLSDRIAAVGLVGAALFEPWSWCRDRRPVPMIDFHGTNDPEAPYNGGKSWVAPNFKGFPPQKVWVKNWARRNGCALTPVDTRVAVDAVKRAYSGCANDADVELYTIEGGGHTWPGGGHHPEFFVGRTTHSIDGSQIMWDFFKRHPLVTTSGPNSTASH